MIHEGGSWRMCSWEPRKRLSAEYVRLSKFLARVLRHRPEEVGLEVDHEGWVAVEDLLQAVSEQLPSWRHVQRSDLEQIIANSEKTRYQIQGDRIRALYGHSTHVAVDRSPQEPPEVLYHGSAARNLDRIIQEGLHPMRRQNVHLSTDRSLAAEVARRHGRSIVMFKVNARAAWKAGIRFYVGSGQIWVSDAIPSEFIERLKD